jgi:hypothetical protein
MGEDEFYDAVENALDKLEEEQEYRDKLKLMSNAMSHQPETISEATQHQLWSTINTVIELFDFVALGGYRGLTVFLLFLNRIDIFLAS